MNLRSMLASGLLAVILTASFTTAPLLTGCSQFGFVKAEDFPQKLAAGYQSVTTGSKIVGSILAAGKISAADARNVHSQLTTAKEALDLADQIHVTDAPAGEARLQATLVGLDAILAYLRSKE